MSAEPVPFWKTLWAQLRKEWWILLAWLVFSAVFDYRRHGGLFGLVLGVAGTVVWILFCAAGVVWRRQAEAEAKAKTNSEP